MMTEEEAERLLRYGAYDALAEDKSSTVEAESKSFVEEDIETILLNRTKTRIHGATANGFSFNKASFKASKDDSFPSERSQDCDVDVDDPDFWSKMFNGRNSKANADSLKHEKGKSDTKMHSSLKYKQGGGPFPDIEVERDIEQQRAGKNDDDDRDDTASDGDSDFGYESDRGSNGNHKEEISKSSASSKGKLKKVGTPSNFSEGTGKVPLDNSSVSKTRTTYQGQGRSPSKQHGTATDRASGSCIEMSAGIEGASKTTKKRGRPPPKKDKMAADAAADTDKVAAIATRASKKRGNPTTTLHQKATDAASVTEKVATAEVSCATKKCGRHPPKKHKIATDGASASCTKEAAATIEAAGVKKKQDRPPSKEQKRGTDRKSDRKKAPPIEASTSARKKRDRPPPTKVSEKSSIDKRQRNRPNPRKQIPYHSWAFIGSSEQDTQKERASLPREKAQQKKAKLSRKHAVKGRRLPGYTHESVLERMFSDKAV